MKTEEKMTAYIQNTKIKETKHHELVLEELQTVWHMCIVQDYFDALELMFNYGRAKGYRLAQKEISDGKSD